jgi:hypothetical protein
MMSEVVEITEYKYYTFSSRDSSTANTVVMLYGAGTYLGAAFFSTDSAPLQAAKKYPSGVYGLFYRYADLPGIIDMLRNEKPVYLIFNDDLNSRISTTNEPVGEGEDL